MSAGGTSNQSDFLQFCKSLANEKRQFIVFEILGDKNAHTVGEIAKRAQIAVSTASEHLAILKRAGVVSAQKKDREVFYKLDADQITKVAHYLNTWLNCC